MQRTRVDRQVKTLRYTVQQQKNESLHYVVLKSLQYPAVVVESTVLLSFKRRLTVATIILAQIHRKRSTYTVHIEVSQVICHKGLHSVSGTIKITTKSIQKFFSLSLLPRPLTPVYYQNTKVAGHRSRDFYHEDLCYKRLAAGTNSS